MGLCREGLLSEKLSWLAVGESAQHTVGPKFETWSHGCPVCTFFSLPSSLLRRWFPLHLPHQQPGVLGLKHNLKVFLDNFPLANRQSGGGGTCLGKVVQGSCATIMTPFSGQSALPSLPIYHHCATHMPPFSIFRKILHFQTCFQSKFQLCALKTQIVKNFHS